MIHSEYKCTPFSVYNQALFGAYIKKCKSDLIQPMDDLAEKRRKILASLVTEDVSLADVSRMFGKPDRQIKDMISDPPRKSFGDKVARSMEIYAIQLGHENIYPYFFDGLRKEEKDTDEMPMFMLSKPISRAIDLDETDEYLTIKRVDFKLSAGISGYSVEYLNGDKAPIIFRRDWVESNGFDPESLYAIKISGHSMETSLYDGDLVVVNVDDIKAVDGDVFAVNYEGELVVKRMLRQSGSWYLSSDNPDKRKYSDKICHEECILIGRVIYKQSERI